MMKKKGESWKIYDVKIEGVSLVAITESSIEQDLTIHQINLFRR
ncbi:MAG: ABC transporter substrate-binding protein [Desulfamplus sp.]|nr:ABC transporter substrate-binding protein [Desulfamplus sp.]